MPEEGLNRIEIRSEEIQDILGQVPHWIVRWGTLVILFTVAVLIAGSFVFRYPDIKRAQIIVTTENPPAALVAKVNGQIENFFVKENENVKAGTALAVIENPASYSDIVSLQFDLVSIRTALANLKEEEPLDLNNNYTLGEVQTAYAEFVNLYQDYYQFLALDYHTKTIKSKQEELQRYRILSERQESQSLILKQNFELASRQYSRDSGLYMEGHMAEVEAERSLQTKLQKQLSYEESKTALSQTEIQISVLNQDILDLELKQQEENQQKQARIRESFEKLNAAIEMWKQNYLLEAPIDGVVTLPSYWSENQNVRVGDRVMTVIPADQGDIIGRMNLPVEGAGKVKLGHRVNIQFANFPHLEYGMVRGNIRMISQVPDENQLYAVEVELPDGLVTYYDKEIPFTQEMAGRAEIITDDRRMIQRITSPIRSMLSEQRETRENSGQ